MNGSGDAKRLLRTKMTRMASTEDDRHNNDGRNRQMTAAKSLRWFRVMTNQPLLQRRRRRRPVGGW